MAIHTHAVVDGCAVAGDSDQIRGFAGQRCSQSGFQFGLHRATIKYFKILGAVDHGLIHVRQAEQFRDDLRIVHEHRDVGADGCSDCGAVCLLAGIDQEEFDALIGIVRLQGLQVAQRLLVGLAVGLGQQDDGAVIVIPRHMVLHAVLVNQRKITDTFASAGARSGNSEKQGQSKVKRIFHEELLLWCYQLSQRDWVEQ